MNDNVICFIKGAEVVSDITKTPKAAQFFVDVVVPGGTMKVLVRVDMTKDMNLPFSRGSYINIFSGEAYISSNANVKFAVRIKSSKQISVCSYDKGEEPADNLLRREEVQSA